MIASNQSQFFFNIELCMGEIIVSSVVLLVLLQTGAWLYPRHSGAAGAPRANVAPTLGTGHKLYTQTLMIGSFFGLT